MRGVYAVGIRLLGRNLASRHLHSMEKLDRGSVKDLALPVFLFEGDILSLARAAKATINPSRNTSRYCWNLP